MIPWKRMMALAVFGTAMFATAVGATGCTTTAFCFTDCGTTSSSSGAGTGTGTGGEGGGMCFPYPQCLSTSSGTGTGGDGGCMLTNNGMEICDGIDNDCDGTIDDLEGIDYNAKTTCGTCLNNCLGLANANWDPATVTCTPSANPGVDPGICAGDCTANYHDLDGDGLCEYYCVELSAGTDATCDNNDDDCDGSFDEDVDVCTSIEDCGACNNGCAVFNGTPECVHTGAGACDTSNTKCQIKSCKCDPGDCWWDNDGSYATGCEYQCEISNNGVEICDGIDNDCNGVKDDGIPSVTCQGGQNGICALPANAGMTQCVNGQTLCAGPMVIKPGDKVEVCNNLDDDCDGQADDNPTDVGGACGMSNVFPCSFGTKLCVSGVLTCIGEVDPGSETCNGQDDDCDGVIDNNLTDVQIGMPCNVPVPPPAGSVSGCQQGTAACVSGGIVCQNSVVAAPGAVDGCKVDANCDGLLTNQPDLNSDVHNCGACGNDCYAGSVHSNWACQVVMGMPKCVFQGCQQGFYDNSVPPDNKCETACNFVSAQELCNGIDDNCNGQVDEGVIAPTPKQVCGVAPQANSAECNANVTVACQNGAWKCTFPAGVCNPSCAAAAEVCDALDNDCDGNLNENVGNYGAPCASDDANPVPGDGACRTTGTFVCNGANGTMCSAVKANCAALPGGCTELCDGIDNDCDGTIDETFKAKGSVAAFFMKPTVTKLGASLWMYTYEASRPTATNVLPGTGNGFVTSAPAGTTLDKTKACSVPSKIPWYDVSGTEVEQTCTAMGGRVCSPTEWLGACNAETLNCAWGYGPSGAACTSVHTASKFCNLGSNFDFDMAAPGVQNGLLPTASALLQNCYADWSNANNPAVATQKMFDITGNLREITRTCAADTAACSANADCCSTLCTSGACVCKAAGGACTAATAAQCCSGVCGGGNTCTGSGPAKPGQFTLLGGAFDTQDEDGAACSFNFYNVDEKFKFFDTGFRCCFTQDPTL